MNLRNNKVLVTGAGGFIGSHLTERLFELGADTRAFVHYNSLGRWGWLDYSKYKSEIEVFAGDISDRDSVKSAVDGIDIIFHLAALIGIPYSYHAPLSYVRTNIEGSLNIFQVALDEGVNRVIHTSTSEVYGTAHYVPIDESHPLQGQSPYSASKIGADKLAESFQLSFDLPIVIIRPFNTYGPRQSDRAVIPTIITQCMKGNVVQLGNLTPTRDFNYISDTVAGFICAAESENAIGKTVNIGSGKEISIEDLAYKIAGIMGKTIEVVSRNERMRPKKGEVDRLCAENELAKELFGWTPEYTLEQGLKMTIDWIKKHDEEYRPERYSI